MSHNYLELLAAFLALQCFAKHSHNAAILIRLDSVMAVTYINKLGGTHSLLTCPNHMGLVHTEGNFSAGCQGKTL